jgi:hypothetical protein
MLFHANAIEHRGELTESVRAENRKCSRLGGHVFFEIGDARFSLPDAICAPPEHKGRDDLQTYRPHVGENRVPVCASHVGTCCRNATETPRVSVWPAGRMDASKDGLA